MTSPIVMSIEEAAAKLRARQLSSVELTRQSLAQIFETQSSLNAFITVTEELALEQARRADEELARGIDRGPLHGIPYGLKDNFETKGILTTCGSKIFRDYVPKHDAVVYRQLCEAGAVLVGKTGLHELAYGITSDNPHFGTIRNPRDPARIPGGSSGGSGVAVAAGMVFFAMGSDTGGSIRIPAAFCGCVGFKPTAGLVSREGLMPLSKTLDHAGPLARTVRDAGLVMNALVPSPDAPVNDNPRIGVPQNFYNERVAPTVAAAFERALSGMRGLVPVTLPDPEEVNRTGRLILLKEAADLMQPYANRREDFGSDVLALLDDGRQVSEGDYARALERRREMQTEWSALWDRVDFLLTPTVPVEPPFIGEENVRLECTRFVRAFNVLGWPALAAGIQLIGKPLSDRAVLALADWTLPPQSY